MIQRIFCYASTRCVLERTVQNRQWPVASSRLLFSTSHDAEKDINEANNDNDGKAKNDTTTAWIPPNRPLAGDMGLSHLYDTVAQEPSKEEMDEEEGLRLLLEEEESLLLEEEIVDGDKEDEDDDSVVDWLQTRRAKLKGQMTSSYQPLEVIKHTLLSRDEIISCLKQLGGQDIVEMRKYSHHMGVMILTTGSSPVHISTMADTIVESLKKRKLADMGVVGAQFGAEGSESKQETWRIVDCSNFILHFMTASTRQHLQLEKLWAEEQEDDLRRISLSNEDAIDDYVAANPIPNDYYNALERGEQWTTETLTKSLSKKRWDEPRPSISNSKRRGRRKPRRNR